MDKDKIFKIDIDKVLESKAGSKARYVPGFVRSWLKHIVHQNEINDFIRCIKTGDKNQQNIDYAVETSKIMQAIYDSSEKHTEIKID